jgi:hypothetical protein
LVGEYRRLLTHDQTIRNAPTSSRAGRDDSQVDELENPLAALFGADNI